MSAALSLLFMGGIADSGKTSLSIALAAELDSTASGKVKVIRMSEYMKGPLGAPADRSLNAAVVYVDWKSIGEDKAIEKIGKDIQQFRVDSSINTLIINAHFATYSPGGYMIGIDPSSILKICKFCNLYPEIKDSKAKAAVILVDISVNNVFQRKSSEWKLKEFDEYPTIDGLIDDLEMNRLYSLQYFQTLNSLLGNQRVSYHRAFINDSDLNKPLEQTDAFNLAKSKLRDFLLSEKFIEHS